MKGRARRKINAEQRVADRKINVYEATQQQRNWVGTNGSEQEKRRAQRPHYCYKEGRRGVSATCRICRVEREGGIKPVPSCALPVAQGRNVWTETPQVQKVREAVIERRLRNHPLDCPICDQGGECDLQDQALGYGSESSRIIELKRGVEDKFRGGPVKMVITRCIHCTRCIRYGKQVGNRARGIMGRGKGAEIGIYTAEGTRQSPRAGNRIDRCPVGARTAEVGKFQVRPWESKRVETVDVRDSVGIPRAFKYVGGERQRVRPKRGNLGERLGDKSRYGYDGRENCRRRAPLVTETLGGVWLGREQRRRETICVSDATVREEKTIRTRSVGFGLEGVRGNRVGQEQGRHIRRGTAVDVERRQQRKQNEREGRLFRYPRGVGKRTARRRHHGETSRKGRESTKKARFTRGSNRGYDRPLVRRKRSGVDHKVGSGSLSPLSTIVGLGRLQRNQRGAAKTSMGRKRREANPEGLGRTVIMGAGRWGRQDGARWFKRKGKREKAMEQSGQSRNGTVSVRQHRANTQGRMSI